LTVGSWAASVPTPSVFAAAVVSGTTIKGLMCARESFGLAQDREDAGTKPTPRLSRYQVLGGTGDPVQSCSPRTQGCPSAGCEVAGGGAGEADAVLHTPTRVRVSMRGHGEASTRQQEVCLDRYRWGNMLTNAGFSIYAFALTLRDCLQLLAFWPGWM